MRKELKINVTVLNGRKYYLAEMHCTHNRKLLKNLKSSVVYSKIVFILSSYLPIRFFLTFTKEILLNRSICTTNLLETTVRECGVCFDGKFRDHLTVRTVVRPCTTFITFSHHINPFLHYIKSLCVALSVSLIRWYRINSITISFSLQRIFN